MLYNFIGVLCITFMFIWIKINHEKKACRDFGEYVAMTFAGILMLFLLYGVAYLLTWFQSLTY